MSMTPCKKLRIDNIALQLSYVLKECVFFYLSLSAPVTPSA